MRNTVRQLMAALVAIGLFTGMSVAPVAAADGGLDLGDDGVGIGGDEGVQVGADSDDGVEVGAGGEEGVEVGADTEEGVEASVAGEEVTDGAPNDVTSGGETLDGNGVDDAPATEGLPGTNASFAPGTGEGLNLTGITGLEVCDLLRTSNDELPTSSLPGLDTLPPELAPPGVPTNLLTTETVVGLATGAVPGGCEVVDAEDPQLDPTDPPTEPDQAVQVMRFDRVDGGVAGTLFLSGTLNESGDGPSVEGTPGAFVSPTVQDVRPDFVFNVGEGDYGAQPIVRRNNDSVRLRGVVILVGDRGGANVECTDVKEFDGDLSEENLADLGPCEYQLIGIPSLATPEDIFEILGSLGENPPVDPGELPDL